MLMFHDAQGRPLRIEFRHSERMPFMAGETNQPHHHRTNKEQHVIYYHSGCGRILVRDDWYEVSPGELYLVDAESLHSFSAARRDPHTYLEATFILHPHRPLTGLIAELSGAPWRDPLKLDARGRELIEGALDVLRSEAREALDRQSPIVQLRLWELLITLAQLHREHAERLTGAGGAAGAPPSGQRLVDLVHIYLRKNFRRPLAMEELAAYLQRSPSTVAHTYKKHSRRSIGEELRLIRLTRAKELLRNSDYPIGRIAELCGFGDAAHFSRSFKAAERQTPKEYRAQVLAEPK
ncbi:MAG: hypothetical protein AMXMBFR7_40380 [Planctomycetota bacterium]